MSPSTIQSVQEYFRNQEPKQRALLLELRSLILEIVPEAQESLNYSIPAYTLTPSTKLEAKVMIAGFRNHVGLYPHPDTIAHFADELSSFKQGKGSVQFPLTDPLPLELIRKMIEWRRDQLKG